MKGVFTQISLLLVVIVCVPAQSLRDEEFDKLASQAALAQTRGEYQVAAKLYRELAAARPDQPTLRVNLGLMLHLSGDYKGAVRQFKEALSHSDSLFTANLFAGVDLIKLGQYSAALTYLTKANQLNREDTLVQLSLGQLYADLGNYEKANDYYFHATNLDPGNLDAWFGLGVTYLSVQRGAIEMVAQREDSAEYLKRLASGDLTDTIEDHSGDRGSFLRVFKRAHDHPDNGDAVFDLAVMSGSLAQDAIARVLELDPFSSRVHVLVGNAFSEVHNVAKAEAEFKKALSNDPGQLSAHLGLATMYAREANPTWLWKN